MAKRNRATLRKFFKKGQIPREEHFYDLIDSTLNIIDEGFLKTSENGIEISLIGESNKIFSVYHNSSAAQPLWTCATDLKINSYVISDRENIPVLSITQEHKIGINTPAPAWELDVKGTIASSGRIGNFKQGTVPANGKWHTIIDNLDGCNAFEIISGVGKHATGKYALMHALAVSTFHSRNRIRVTQAHYGLFFKKMKLRWVGKQHSYGLQLKTRSNYGADVNIQYNISLLWFDPFMKNSNPNTDHTSPEFTSDELT
jgi:hypothetical protein